MLFYSHIQTELPIAPMQDISLGT